MDSEESQEKMRVADDYWRCVQSNSSFKKEDVYKYTWLRKAEGRVSRQDIDGLCVVTTTNASKT